MMLIRIPVFINVISYLYHQIAQIITQEIKEISTMIHIIAQIILSGLFFITGILRFFMIKIIDKSDLFLFLICCNFKRKLYNEIDILKKWIHGLYYVFRLIIRDKLDLWYFLSNNIIMFETPILFLLFNRLNTSQKVFNKIKEQKPKYLYIAADWPRKNIEWEDKICMCIRQKILQQIDWECEVKTLFRDENLWCKMAVSWAITRFFENVEQWIILEDDCFPDSSFFWFCETMLEKYKDDERVMHISWSCHLSEKYHKKNTYVFPRYEHIWGWATWRRGWNLYDIEMTELDNFIKNWQINNITDNFFTKKINLQHFKDTRDWKIDTRDYERRFCLRTNNWVAIQPLTNLVSNIWFWDWALNTKNDLWMWNRPTEPIDFNNLNHPKNFITNKEYRIYDEKHVQFSFKQYIAIYFKKLWIYKVIAKLLWYNV